MAELVEKLAWIHHGATQMGGTYVISEKSCPMFIDEFEERFSTHSQTKLPVLLTKSLIIKFY